MNPELYKKLLEKLCNKEPISNTTIDLFTEQSEQFLISNICPKMDILVNAINKSINEYSIEDFIIVKIAFSFGLGLCFLNKFDNDYFNNNPIKHYKTLSEMIRNGDIEYLISLCNNGPTNDKEVTLIKGVCGLSIAYIKYIETETQKFNNQFDFSFLNDK